MSWRFTINKKRNTDLSETSFATPNGFNSFDYYGVKRWGRRFFGVDPDGFLNVVPDNDDNLSLRIMDVIEHFAPEKSAPMVIRFPGIIRQRAKHINDAFRRAIKSYGYKGTYRLFYPVKVNQHREVIAAALEAGRAGEGGLEAGSKAELLAVIAMADQQTPILCNGFKDQTVIEMAFRAQQVGRDITVIIEKPTEIDLVLRISKKLGIRPQLGVRVKLSSKVTGRWSGSAGAKSKFGLSIPELTQGIERLRSEGLIGCVKLLHFHPGSQITNVHKIKAALIEVARVYVNLTQEGVPIETIDVGGGLAVDYTGNRNREPSSMNYTLREYANDVVSQIQIVCDQTGTAHPNIFSESGRALVAHHSLLVVPIIGTSNNRRPSGRDSHTSTNQGPPIDASKHPPLQELKEVWENLAPENLLESYHDTQSLIESSLEMFSNGILNLQERAYAELTGRRICEKINALMAELDFVPEELSQLKFNLAGTYFGNFSLFQALPDAWALNHLFPIMPIHRLNERPTVEGVLGDITCDSDGKIDCFVGSAGELPSLAMHELTDEPYYLAVLLIGAYQEALSDDHNLMGKFHIATIHDPADRLSWEMISGSDLEDVLAHVHHDTDRIESSIQSLIESAESEGMVDSQAAARSRRFFRDVLSDYTYLNG